VSAPPARTPSPLWLLPPACLFALEIITVLVNGETNQQTNAAYHFGDVLGLGAFTLVLGLYTVAAVHFSRLDLRETLAIRRTPLRPALRDGAAALAVIVVANVVLNPLLNADQAQGIVPERSPRTDQEWLILGLALVIVGVLVPICEELFFRGLAFASLGRLAVVGSALLFASAHVLPEVLPIVLIAGLALAEVRKRTDSVIPGMFVHSALNVSALLLAVLA
jgi:membrane protease YdiL (CAAX protease family)